MSYLTCWVSCLRLLMYKRGDIYYSAVIFTNVLIFLAARVFRIVVFDKQRCALRVHRAIHWIDDFAADKYFPPFNAINFSFYLLSRVERYKFFVIDVQIRCYCNSFCLEHCAAETDNNRLLHAL